MAAKHTITSSDIYFIVCILCFGFGHWIMAIIFLFLAISNDE